ncbi:hypothetical protein PS928_03656 [Pseudomonas fluorescens]|uniref:Uncharacterized protein n=1 Tax=Pseudomonas fluorescens TaxID=294 RepID=A0A5E7ULY5_PSEFL|nr:hypothetical protein PS928_03656 [Pseudomonas fluorescens]
MPTENKPAEPSQREDRHRSVTTTLLSHPVTEGGVYQPLPALMNARSHKRIRPAPSGGQTNSAPRLGLNSSTMSLSNR